MIHGIIADKNIADTEIHHLRNWLFDNEHLASTYPYDELTALIIDILKDGIITEDEKSLLERYFIEFVDTKNLTSYSDEDIAKIKESVSISGICAVDPQININGSTFCFTGKSSRTSRDGFKDTIESLGGNVSGSVTKKTNYLIVGDEGNPCWAYSCYGRKIEKAIEMRASGAELVIVHENDFGDLVD